MKDYRKGYLMIPNTIKTNTKLSLLSKMVFSEILSYDEMGLCYASNNHFALIYNVDVRTIERVIKELRDNKYISTSYNRKFKRRTITILSKYYKELEEINNEKIDNADDKEVVKSYRIQKEKNASSYKNVNVMNLKKIWSE